MNALFRGKYGISWSEEFLVTASNHSAYLETRDASKYPRILYVSNTFDLLYEDKRIKTSSFFESIALWLEIIRTIYAGRVPIKLLSEKSLSSKRARSAENNRSYMARKRFASESGDVVVDTALDCVDINELCQVVRTDHTKFSVKALLATSATMIMGSLVPGKEPMAMILE